VGALLVAISTNEVFDGTAKRPYQEYDQRNPINPYGYSKYVAEQAVERIAPRYMIVRTAWLYASGGVNFIHKIIARARSGTRLRVVTDEISSPTSVTDLAAALMELIEIERPGIYHLTNAGECSRYHFAREILRLIGSDVPIEPISLDDFVRPSMPPAYAPLANVFGAAAGIEMRPWQEALAEYIAQYEA
jgi:dTDP-4-dehydrorhamnose reductase